jgi:hypothetical protein
MEWDTSETDGLPMVTIRRRLLSVNGREPRPRDLEACLMPEMEDLDPLSVLLPVRQASSSLQSRDWSGSRADRRDAHAAVLGRTDLGAAWRRIRAALLPRPGVLEPPPLPDGRVVVPASDDREGRTPATAPRRLLAR